MTDEDKLLLIKDLSARLPYGVIINAPSNIFYPTDKEDIKLDSVFEIDGNFHVSEDYGWPIETCKPYLRPLSSMTEDEKETYQMFFNEDGLLNTSIDTYLDWLLEGHFDFRGLISKGLALEVPENFYNN